MFPSFGCHFRRRLLRQGSSSLLKVFNRNQFISSKYFSGAERKMSLQKRFLSSHLPPPKSNPLVIHLAMTSSSLGALTAACKPGFFGARTGKLRQYSGV